MNLLTRITRISFLVLGMSVLSGCGLLSQPSTPPVVPPSVISIADATVTEGVAGSTTISMTNPTGRTCSLAVTTTNGSAIAPGDYDAISGASFTLSAASDFLSVTPVDDHLIESPETYTITIALEASSDPKCQIGKGTASITVNSNDVASVVSIADATVTEGLPGSTTISMTNPSGRSCELAVTTTNGTATAPGDYQAIAGAAFTLSASSEQLSITPFDDNLIEQPETYTITIALTGSTDPRCQIGDGTATITIISEDVASVVSIADATITEGVAGTTTISMTNPTGRVCSLVVTTVNGTATAPGDYTPISGALFGLPSASDTLSITPVNDKIVEQPETYTIRLDLTASSDPQCQIGDGTATITIISDE